MNSEKHLLGAPVLEDTIRNFSLKPTASNGEKEKFGEEKVSVLDGRACGVYVTSGSEHGRSFYAQEAGYLGLEEDEVRTDFFYIHEFGTERRFNQ
ncbi:hypothetical protein HY524_00140 [Candidatus Berkelbacteria bacterium]|nr:hypothetical protein [Candidatus Berkelbacteria bacterium]